MSTVVIRRRARIPPAPVPSDPIGLEAPPEMPSEKSGANWMMALPMLAGGGAMAFMVVGRGGSTAMLGGGLMMLAMLSMAFMSVGRGGKQRKAQIYGDRRDYLRYLDLMRERVRAVADQQRASLVWQHPHPHALWTIAASRRLWERRTSEVDFGQVRVGLGPQRLATTIVPPDTGLLEDLESVSAVALRRFVRAHSTVPHLPIAVSLRAFSHVALVGEHGATQDVARAMIGQLCALHSPDDVVVAICAAPERLPSWDWVKWLPHAQHPRKSDGAGHIRLVADSWRQLEEWLEDVLGDRPGFAADAPLGDDAFVLVVVDGGQVDADAMLAPGRSPYALCSLVLTSDAPPELTHTLRLGVTGGMLTVLGGEDERPLAQADSLSSVDAEALARVMAPFRVSTQTGVEDSADDPLAASAELMDMLGLGDPGELDVRRAWRPRANSERLKIPIGPGGDGRPVYLDIKESAQGGMGPHGLVIGATGSGKSELLRTMVLGFAATHSSETLNLVLVDFKGGATFAGLADLPHTAAVITNLQDDLTLVDRMRDAIAGELNRRQEALRDAGNFASVRDYEKARASGAALAPLPSLLIICDEFSELLSAKPDFIDLFLAIGRLGRSLSVHLCLASQRLEEGKLRGLDSHLSYRVGLKTFSAAESRTVLGVPDAYELPPIPGSGFLKVDTEMVRFKAAYVSGQYVPMQPVARADGELRASGVDIEPVVYSSLFAPSKIAITAGVDDKVVPTAPTVIDNGEDTSSAGEDPVRTSVLDVLVGRMQGQGPPAHAVWLPPLADAPTLDQLVPGLAATADRGLCVPGSPRNGSLAVPIGIVDRPFDQRRDPLIADLSGAAGHAMIVGAPQSGKSTMVRALIGSLALHHTPAEVQFYCLDFGGGTLATLGDLPHVGTIATRLETDSVRRLVAEVNGVVNARERLFLEHRLDSMAAYRARRARGEVDDGLGDVFLVIDNGLVLRQEFEPLEQIVNEIAARGLTYGVHVVITANRWAEVRPALKDLISTRFELRLGDPSDSEVDRRVAMNVPIGAPGRGLTKGKLHFLGGLPRIDGSSSALDLADGAQAFSEAVRDAWSGPPARPVRMLPDLIEYDELPQSTGAPGQLLLGIDEAELAPLYLDVDADAHLLVFGDGESGKTGLLRALARGIAERYTPDQARISIVDYRRTLLGAVPDSHLLDYSATAKAVTTSVRDIAGAMEQRVPGPDVTSEQLRTRSWWKGPELFVLVDDYDLVATQSGNPLLPLAELIPQGKDIGLHVILARRSGGAARALYDPLIQRIRELGMPGLLLSGTKDEGVLIGTTKPMPLAPGRGQLVTRRRGAELVQLAWVKPE